MKYFIFIRLDSLYCRHNMSIVIDPRFRGYLNLDECYFKPKREKRKTEKFNPLF